MNILTAFIALLIGTIVGFTGYVFHRISVLQRTFREFITPIDDKTASPLAQVTQSCADILARSMVMQLKATFMGKQSGDSRASQAVMADIVTSEAQQNPMVGGLIQGLSQSFPALGKSLRRNPQLLDYALQYLSSRKNGNNHNETSVKESPKFKF